MKEFGKEFGKGLYVLDPTGERPMRCDDWECWLEWFENADRRVATTLLSNGKIVVSTVFLGVDHGLSGQPPVLWETMTFRVIAGEISGDSLDYDRCSGTREQAQAMHQSMCSQVEALLSLEMELKA